MDFRNPPAAQESSHNVEIICQEMVPYSFGCHLFAALRREGISSFVNTRDFSGGQNQAISVVVSADGPFFLSSMEVYNIWIHKSIKIIKHRRGIGTCAAVTRHKSRFTYYMSSYNYASIFKNKFWRTQIKNFTARSHFLSPRFTFSLEMLGEDYIFFCICVDIK